MAAGPFLPADMEPLDTLESGECIAIMEEVV
jgi:hypothetical protein